MKTNKISTNSTIFFNILSTVILQGLAFFTAPVFSRVLGTANYGVVSVYATWVSVMSCVFSLQVGSSIAMARNEFPLEQQAAYRSAILGMAICSYCMALGAILIFLSPLSGILRLPKWMLVLACIHSFGSFCVSYLNGIFVYDFKAGRNLALSVLTSVSSILLSLYLINRFPKEANYQGRIIALTTVYAVLGVVICFYLFYTGKTFFNKRYWKFCLPLSLPIIFHSLSNLLLGQSDRVMIRQMMGDSDAGIYSLATNFSVALSTIYGALNNSWVPFFHEDMREMHYKTIDDRIKNYLELFTVLSIGFILLTPEVYHVFANEEYWPGTAVVPVLAIGYYMVFLYSFPVNYEFYRKKTKVIATATVLAALINILLNAALIPRHGIFGAAWATAVAHVVQFLIHHFFASRLQKGCDYRFSLMKSRKYLIAFAGSAVMSGLTGNLWLVRWIAGGCLGIWELYRIKKRKTIF